MPLPVKVEALSALLLLGEQALPLQFILL